MSSRAESLDSFGNFTDDHEEDGEDSSDEDTEEASEADVGKVDDYMEIQEQMYQDKCANIRKQLQQLKEGTHPEYNRKNKHLEAQRRDRDMMNVILKAYNTDILERNHAMEMKAAAKECEEKRNELRESLIAEYEEKRRQIEIERGSQELIGDAPESKPVMTRKLRRRPNDPAPIVEKRRKAGPYNVIHLLDEKDIEADLKAIVRSRTITPQMRRLPLPGGLGMPPIPNQSDMSYEPRIEDGKLRYEKRFYHRGQPVFVTEKDMPRFAANIHTIGSDSVWVKKVSDASKFRITLWHLAKKKIHIERRVP